MKEKDGDRDLFAEVEQLERRQQELQRLTEKQAARNQHRRELHESLALLGLGRRWWRPVALMLLVSMTPAAGYCYYKLADAPGPAVRKVVHRPLTDHLLVTSAPDGAEVFVDGKRVGRTPLFRGALTGRDQFELRLQAPGFAPATRTLERGLIDDAHWHAVLRPLPRPAGADGGPR